VKLELTGTEHVACDLASARAFLADAARVSRCLPDLEEVTLLEARRFVAVVRVGVGPVRGRFKMDVELAPSDDGNHLALSLRGSGMGSGLAMTSALSLTPVDAAHTDLAWSAEASVSGPLASVGGRLLEAQARKTTEQLFAAIRAALEREVDGQVAVP
jgi:carbon monoxide dehydrogenase subunit G